MKAGLEYPWVFSISCLPCWAHADILDQKGDTGTALEVKNRPSVVPAWQLYNLSRGNTKDSEGGNKVGVDVSHTAVSFHTTCDVNSVPLIAWLHYIPSLDFLIFGSLVFVLPTVYGNHAILCHSSVTLPDGLMWGIYHSSSLEWEEEYVSAVWYLSVTSHEVRLPDLRNFYLARLLLLQEHKSFPW